MKKDFSLQELLDVAPVAPRVIGTIAGKTFSGAKSISEAQSSDLVFIGADRKDKLELLKRTQAVIVICDDTLPFDDFPNKCFLVTKEPKLFFVKVVQTLFPPPKLSGIHPSAVIHPEADISSTAWVGPNCYVGRCKIDDGTQIAGNCFLYDNTRVGKNVRIHAGTVIGADGFGYIRTPEDEIVPFPHLGGVLIEDNVEIGSNTSIDRGSLGDTVLRKGSRIDNLVHIAHNVEVGENAFVIANAMIGGSTKIGPNAWIAPSATLRDLLSIGAKATVGLGAVVTKDVPSGETWLGSPARPINEFRDIQKSLTNRLTK